MTPAFPSFILLPTSTKSSTSTPDLAVMIPSESTFFTSSYVKTPPTVTLPEKFAVVPDSAPVNVAIPAFTFPKDTCGVPVILLAPPVKFPTKDTAVIIPVEFILICLF